MSYHPRKSKYPTSKRSHNITRAIISPSSVDDTPIIRDISVIKHDEFKSKLGENIQYPEVVDLSWKMIQESIEKGKSKLDQYDIAKLAGDTEKRVYKQYPNIEGEYLFLDLRIIFAIEKFSPAI